MTTSSLAAGSGGGGGGNTPLLASSNSTAPRAVKVPTTVEQIQNLLEENDDFMKACLDYQNLGRVHEAVQYQSKVHQNLLTLGKLADACILERRVLGIQRARPREAAEPGIVDVTEQGLDGGDDGSVIHPPMTRSAMTALGQHPHLQQQQHLRQHSQPGHHPSTTDQGTGGRPSPHMPSILMLTPPRSSVSLSSRDRRGPSDGEDEREEGQEDCPGTLHALDENTGAEEDQDPETATTSTETTDSEEDEDNAGSSWSEKEDLSSCSTVPDSEQDGLVDRRPPSEPFFNMPVIQQ